MIVFNFSSARVRDWSLFVILAFNKDIILNILIDIIIRLNNKDITIRLNILKNIIIGLKRKSKIYKKCYKNSEWGFPKPVFFA